MNLNIKVAVRCRPMTSKEQSRACVDIITVSDTALHMRGVSAQYDEKDFTFDYCYGSDSLQTKVYADLGQPMVLRALDGFNGTIFAYGQTGSGKSFSMMGNAESKGIIPLLNEDLFEKLALKLEQMEAAALQQNSNAKTKFLVSVSFLEVYNEDIKDLLNPSEKKLKIRESPLGINVGDLSELIVHSASDMMQILFQGNGVRRVAATKRNEKSSRSHSVFTIKVEQKTVTELASGKVQEDTVTAKVNFVDLAGLQHAETTDASGATLKAGATINLSLTALGNVINLLSERAAWPGKEVIPYRDSTLTRLLQDSLGGNTTTVMIATISPADYNYSETLSTLQFAYKAKSITNVVTRNVDSNELVMGGRHKIEALNRAAPDSGIERDTKEMEANFREEKGKRSQALEAERQANMNKAIFEMMNIAKEQKVQHIKNIEQLTNEKIELTNSFQESKESNMQIKRTLDLNIAQYQVQQQLYNEQMDWGNKQAAEAMADKMIELLTCIENDRVKFTEKRDDLKRMRQRLDGIEEELIDERAELAESVTMAASTNNALLANALKQGSKPWKRSKFSLLGQGRAGKTAFANAIAGRQFEETASTVGINQLTCDVKHIQAGTAGDGSGAELAWSECTKNVREYEAALADIMTRAQHDMLGKASGDIRAYMNVVTALHDADASEEADDQGEGYVTVSGEGAEEGSGVEKKQVAVTQEILRVVGGEGGDKSPAIVGESGASARRKIDTRLAPVDDAPLDEDMVMKMLATMQDVESGLLISLFDFGGQSVFEVIHHLFLTRNGVYALVFNMEWLLTDGPDKERALRFMRGWLSSIAVHTFNKTTQMTAPIVIVGTRLDTVTSPAAHEKISTILYEHFSDNLAWRSVVGNEEGSNINGRAFQWFFPVDNKLGNKGAAMKHLMSVVQGTIDKAEYTHKEVPLTWFKAIDQMADTLKDCLSLQEVAATAQRCDVSEQEVPLLLSFLHDMGHLMWLDEPGLRDVVILDPVSYLVVPATVIICKLSPDHEDSTHHFMASHRECERMHKREWMLLKHSGVLSVKLLPILWEPYAPHTEALLMLMIKFGLLVPLRSDGEGPVTQYLVPTLLAPSPLSHTDVANWADGPFSSCFFVYTLVEELGQSSTVTEAELKSVGFLPGGMFERIVGKALSWSQDTARGCSIDLQRVMLHKDMAVLAFGRQRFRLVHCADIHCMRVDVEGANPVGIQQKLFDFIKRIIDECMKSLLCFPAVVFHSEAAEDVTTSPSLSKGLLHSELLIPLQQLRKAGKGTSMLSWRGGRTLITLPEIKSKYGQWLQLFERRERYDVFISYRWGRYDSEFTEQLFDMFTNFSVGAQSRAVEVFLDRKRLQEGRQFKNDFGAALTHSLVALPVVSLDALDRLFEHVPSTVDNVLLEWIMILESFAAGRTLKVFPILFGKRDILSSNAQGKVVTVADLFLDGSLNKLPCIAPTATLAQATNLLRANGINPSESMLSYTVHSVVHELLQFLLCKASDFASNRLVESFAGKVVKLLEDCEDLSAAPTIQAEQPAVQALPSVSHDSAAPAIVPAPTVTAKTASQRTGLALRDLTAEEVGELLERSGYKKVRPVFLANEVTGKHLFLCEEFADLMAEEIGVTSKPVAKLLMESIEGWRRDGVSL